MRLLLLAGAALPLAADILQYTNQNGLIEFQLDQGTAGIEFFSPATFRFTRLWTTPFRRDRLEHDPVPYTITEKDGRIEIASSQLRLDLERRSLALTVRDRKGQILCKENNEAGRFIGVVTLHRATGPNERLFGLGYSGEPGPSLRGKKGTATRRFLYSSAGYAQFVRTAGLLSYDFSALSSYRLDLRANELDYFFYYGPTLKEALQEHYTYGQGPDAALPARTVAGVHPGEAPPGTTPLPLSFRNPTEFARSVEMLIQESLSGVRYPAIDIAALAEAPPGLRARAEQLLALLPVLYASRTTPWKSGLRDALEPYRVTYLREGFDRGFPLIHPRLFQFPRDSDSVRPADWFLLGDEILIAPVTGPGATRTIELPRGIWTDWRTNVEHPGRRTVQIDAPPDYLPMLLRNGSLLPVAAGEIMELHYFPKLGGEFFLWESELEEVSQFHAAPAADAVRLQIESKVARTYEWVIHHLDRPRQLTDNGAPLRETKDPARRRPGEWFYDAGRRNLHVRADVEARSDRIFLVSF
jgi:hypothetical protein